jgi:tetratricopeptide (TPR) repeat protein
MKYRNLLLRGRAFWCAFGCALCLIFSNVAAAQKRASKPKMSENAGEQKTRAAQNGGEASADELNDDLDSISVRKPAEQIAALKDFLQYEAPKEVRQRAKEMLIAAYAASGNERLNAGDTAGCLADFREAVKLAPSKSSEDGDKLFVAVAQLPASLFLRGESDAAFELARSIEAKATGNAKRLLAVAIFYLGVEQGAEAARVAQQVIQLAPAMSEAYQTLGAAYRIEFKLEDAAQAYARALELDPKSSAARENLANLKRALGKTDEALALYREQLAAKPDDKAAQSGVVLTLFDKGDAAEARKELHEALVKDRNNLPLLVGAAYWFDAHGDFDHGYELAQHAVRIEPRYTWGHIALARALIGLKDAPAAERSLRYAKQFGNYPTLAYEYANALAANGYYDEAAEELARAFAIKDGQIETRLAGRQTAQASNFLDLLAPERRAGIFQNAAADTEANARQLKSLLAFYLAAKAANSAGASVEMNGALAATDFIAGDDEMSAFRQMYVANRLLALNGGKSVAQRAFELTEMAIRGAEAALNSPLALYAIFAEDLRDLRADAFARGVVPELPQVPRETLSNVLRGRIEDTAGWALFLQNNNSEASVRLKRAVSVLPPKTLMWRNAMWHLGAALEASGNSADALKAYLASYDENNPNPARRAIIEAVYRRVNGSLDGLDAKIGAAQAIHAVAETKAPPTQSASLKSSAGNSTAVNASPANPTPPPSENSAADLSSNANRAANSTLLPAANEAAKTTGETAANQTAPPKPAMPLPPPILPSLKTSSAVEIQTRRNDSVNAPNVAAVDASNANDEKKASVEERNAVDRPAASENAASDVSTSGEARANETSVVSRAALGRQRPRRARRDAAAAESNDAKCFSLSAREIEIEHAGAAARLTVKLNDGLRASDIKFETPNWADIVILPQTEKTDDDALVLLVRSVSQNSGNFKINFKSPCGKREVSVMVKP